MLKINPILSSIISLGLLLGFSQVASAREASEASGQFHRIEQPLPLKVGVTLGGLSLIGIEIWWFLLSKNKAKRAKESQGVREI